MIIAPRGYPLLCWICDAHWGLDFSFLLTSIFSPPIVSLFTHCTNHDWLSFSTVYTFDSIPRWKVVQGQMPLRRPLSHELITAAVKNSGNSNSKCLYNLLSFITHWCMVLLDELWIRRQLKQRTKPKHCMSTPSMTKKNINVIKARLDASFLGQCTNRFGAKRVLAAPQPIKRD